MDERRWRVGSLFEWMAAALCVLAIVWAISVPIQHLLGPRVDAALIGDVREKLPPGVPGGATSVPVMLLLDGRAIRVGELESAVRTILPERFAEGPAHVSATAFGDRQTRAYSVDGSRFFVVCERDDRAGPLKVAGIYVP